MTTSAHRIVSGPERFFFVTGSTRGVDALAQSLTASPDVAVRVLDGARARDKTSFLAEAARALSFPSCFGGNWDAFEECLGDLVWQPPHHHLVFVRRGDELLADAASERRIFAEILSAIELPAGAPRARLQLVCEVPDTTRGFASQLAALGHLAVHLDV